jgi:glycosyltransferase involved in cell wall biosynthesis
MKIPVIINNYNLLTWPKAMVEQMKSWEGINEIIIIDNASTYEPLLEWYETNPCTIVRLEQNLGQAAPWKSGFVDTLSGTYYAVTDPDLDLSGVNKRVISKCIKKLSRFPSLGKVGLSLDYEDVQPSSSYYNHMNNYEKPRQLGSRRFEGLLLDVAVDTTFAVYNVKQYFIGGASLLDSAKHIPWYYSEEERKADAEFSQYIASASNACSYKTFLKL